MFWDQAEQVTKQALAKGRLFPIATKPSVVVQDGIPFLLHTKLDNYQKKPKIGNKSSNPFLPYEPDMYVGDAGEFHVCLLNKFPVLSPHLLICTREFVPQTQLLTLADFEAWLLGFTEPDVVGFYNGGEIAGASQMHRHMQLVRAAVPIAAIIHCGGLGCKHQLYCFTALNAKELFAAYQQAMYQLALINADQCLPHNIVLTQEWLLIVPRTQAHINQILVNGLNYTGRFLLKNDEQRQWLQNYGLLKLLTECGQPQ
ncbi:phosphorylase [Endozoicomonas sp. SM1973]|uniref:Phosphorylase n=1 Tax=Spartinivicinus marinus TaxID=2994442 RepID=A0A853IEH3_9GAMM|nr:DUF4922 domain-containing protein [Spartinivicinus marinus]MCX4029226.1 DUF4922 domain-containing protein [Spartinivicinus marinus]NYZ65866.1 phosphorylase [Spartinivicinus marinus]